jgi:voltage-gated potassium channel
MSDATTTSPPPEQVTFMDVLVLVTSAYVLVVLLLEMALPMPPPVRELLDNADLLVCVVFFVDFVRRFIQAKSKLAFMKWGWLDLLASLPLHDPFHLGIAVRVQRIIRMLRGFRSARHIAMMLYHRRATNTLYTVILCGVILVVWSAAAVLRFEDDPNSNIRSPMDALWWAMTTITTVGYGDRYPVTFEGRLVAMLLMVVGIGLFGVLTGLFAKIFMETEIKEETSDIALLTAELRALRTEVAELKQSQPSPKPAALSDPGSEPRR